MQYLFATKRKIQSMFLVNHIKIKFFYLAIALENTEYTYLFVIV